MIAALFVQAGGCYSRHTSIDPWDEARDARNYTGPWPVIAHPPCQLWGKFAKINYKRWGGEHNKPGNDGGCFKSALDAVNKYRGILEHPAQSYAWSEYGLVRPEKGKWKPSGQGWVCEVWQNAYGHKARKATWLYFVGAQRPPELRWSYNPAEYQIGYHDQRGKDKNKPTVTKKEASATPIEFRDLLISIVNQGR